MHSHFLLRVPYAPTATKSRQHKTIPINLTMAAPSNKPSPTNRPVEGVDKTSDAAAAFVAAKPAPEAVVASAPEAAPAKPDPSDDPIDTPTYQSVESGDVYLLAKRHLNKGEFEEAMSVIEEGIRDTQELLKKITNSPDGDFTLHESMAPFHYLYGTTLLYSIEETDQEMTTAGSAVSTAVVSGDQAALPGVAAAAEQEQDEDGEGVQTAEDMQIAWENLETARQIMEKMFDSNENNEMVEKLELDLAQIYLREGDLQRINGRYEASISDYQSCLRLRKKSKFLGTFDRKIADVHYNLGLVYITLASKDEGTGDDDEGDASKKPASAQDEKVKEAKREMARNKGVYHYLECSKCFCGQIASICNADAQSVIDVAAGDEDAKAKSSPVYKTTGEEDEEMELPNVASSKLQMMRKRAAELVSSSDLSGVQQLDVEDLLQLLEEIQETVDEAENSTKGVQEVTNMKAAVAALAAADGEPGESKAEDGSTTTIGFGNAAAASASGATTTTGFGNTASAGVVTSAAPAAPSRPMMVVKKKKRPAVEPAKEPAAKMPKPETE